MEGIKITGNKIVRRIPKRGGMNRHTTCPYCGHMISMSRYKHICGHIAKMWEADGRQYVMFNQYKGSKTN
jgi:hypothetical protein